MRGKILVIVFFMIALSAIVFWIAAPMTTENNISFNVTTEDDSGSGITTEDKPASGVTTEDDSGSGITTEDKSAFGVTTEDDSDSGVITEDESASDAVAESEYNFKWILPPEYYHGNIFREGRAWVQEKRDGPWTLFDVEGNIIKKGFEVKHVTQHANCDTEFLALEKDSKTGWDMYGYIDSSGNILSEAKPYYMSPLFQEGIGTKIGENGLWGCIDYEERWVIPPVYENIQIREDGLMPAKKDGKWGYINKSGDVVIDFRFEQVYLFKNGLSVARDNSLYGLIDQNGNWLTEAIYERFYYPWSHLIAAQKDGKIGYLDAKGNVVIDFKFTAMEGTGIPHEYAVFYNGRAIVPISKDKKDGETIYKWVVINESGDIIPTEQDDFIAPYYSNYAVAVRDKRLFLLDKEGKEFILPPGFQLDEVIIYPSEDGIFGVLFKNEGKIGYFRVEN